MFVYDGFNLLILQFKASSRNDIKEANCRVDCCILPRSSAVPGVCNARYGLYRLVWRGWMRLAAVASQHIPVSLNGWEREFRYWSGRPTWINEINRRVKELDHPDGYRRIFDTANRAWYWAHLNGAPVQDANGTRVWDTVTVP